MEEYHPKIVAFRMLMKDQLEIRLTGEREGRYEDLLMVTILDPRFKIWTSRDPQARKGCN